MKTSHSDLDIERQTPVSGDRLSRVVADEEGHLWRVREVQFADAPPSLIFESDAGFRRIRVYPSNWYSMAEEELYTLSWRT